jgi:hypothetical protein
LRKIPGIWFGIWNGVFLLQDFYPIAFIYKIIRSLVSQKIKRKRESYAEKAIKEQREVGLLFQQGGW